MTSFQPPPTSSTLYGTYDVQQQQQPDPGGVASPHLPPGNPFAAATTSATSSTTTVAAAVPPAAPPYSFSSSSPPSAGYSKLDPESRAASTTPFMSPPAYSQPQGTPLPFDGIVEDGRNPAYVGIAEIAVWIERLKLIRSVYAAMALQFLLASVLVGLALFDKRLRNNLERDVQAGQKVVWVLVGATVLAFGFLLLSLFPARRSPWRTVCIVLYTLLQAVAIGIAGMHIQAHYPIVLAPFATQTVVFAVLAAVLPALHKPLPARLARAATVEVDLRPIPPTREKTLAFFLALSVAAAASYPLVAVDRVVDAMVPIPYAFAQTFPQAGGAPALHAAIIASLVSAVFAVVAAHVVHVVVRGMKDDKFPAPDAASSSGYGYGGGSTAGCLGDALGWGVIYAALDSGAAGSWGPSRANPEGFFETICFDTKDAEDLCACCCAMTTADPSCCLLFVLCPVCC